MNGRFNSDRVDRKVMVVVLHEVNRRREMEESKSVIRDSIEKPNVHHYSQPPERTVPFPKIYQSVRRKTERSGMSAGTVSKTEVVRIEDPKADHSPLDFNFR